MEVVKYFFDLFLHLDKHLGQVITNYGTLTYLILFAVIFAETGFVVTPFLPGDSLLFAAGAFAALETPLNVNVIFALLATAAILGDSINYFFGRYVGPKVFEKENRFIKRAYLIRTQEFYAKHGGKTVIFARFVPIIRTFAPFVAGVSGIPYKKFVTFSIAGTLLWVSLFVYAGFFFGNIPVVKNNFSIVVIAIIFISLLPGIIQVVKAKREVKGRNS